MGNPLVNEEGEDQSFGYVGKGVTGTLTLGGEFLHDLSASPRVRIAKSIFIAGVDLVAGTSTQVSDGDLTMRDISELAGSMFVGGIAGAAVGAAFTGPLAPFGAVLGFGVGLVGGNIGEDAGGAVYDKLTSGYVGPAEVYRTLPNGQIEKQVTQIIGQDGTVGDRTAILHTTIVTYNADGTKTNVEQSSTTVYDGKETIQLIQDSSEADNLLDALKLSAEQAANPEPETQTDDTPDPDPVVTPTPDPDPVVTPTPDPSDETAPSAKLGGGGSSTKVTGSKKTAPEPNPYQPDDGYGGAMMPVILDLDGDGIEIAFGEEIFFDTDGDGFAEKTSWAAADDGFLVLDLNADGTRGAGDGVIDQSNELALSLWGEDGDTDLQALARFDLVENGGGKVIHLV